jgi:3-dehydroquinate dehydratase I
VPSTVTLRYGQSELVIGDVPRIVGTLASANVPKTARAICDIVELRLDLIGGEFSKLETELPLLLTIRSKTEGGQWTGSEEQRLTMYRQFLPHVAAVDVELNSPIAQEVCRLAQQMGKVSIVSFHDFKATPPLKELNQIVERGQQIGSIVKIVTLANEEADVQTLHSLLQSSMFNVQRSKFSAPLCVMGMGKHAAQTRVEFPKLGSCLTYGYLDKALAPGQTSAAELRSALRSTNH